MTLSVNDSAPSKVSSACSIRHGILLLLVAGCLFFVGLGALPLLEPDEGRNSEVAREMLVSGDWITPHFDTLTYLDKPAVFFWLVALSFRMWGLSEWAARFPSALMGVATVLLTWFLARRMFGGGTGLRAGIILATSPLALALSRLATFDITLAFFTSLAMTAFWLGEARQPRPAGLDALMFGAMGVATLTKGPVGFLVPLLSLLAYHALGGRFGEVKRWRWGLGLGVFLAVVSPWLIIVSASHPGFLHYALWQESLRRFATAQARRTGSWAYYIPVYLAGFFPWSFFMLAAGWNRLKRWRELRQETQRPTLFLLAWAVVVFLFFSISQSKLPAYFLSALIPLSILMAQAWAEIESPEARPAPDWLTAGFAVLLGLGILAAFAPHISFLSAGAARAARKLHPSVLATAKPCLLYSGLILAALAIVGRNLAKRTSGRRLSTLAFGLVALTTPFMVLRWIVPLKAYATGVSSRALGQAILASTEKDLPLYGYYYFRTSLPFYLQRPVGLVTADGSETTSNYISLHLRESRHESDQAGSAAAGQPNPVLVDMAELNGLSSRGPMLLLVRNTSVSDLLAMFHRVQPLWSGWEYSVWKIPAEKE